MIPYEEQELVLKEVTECLDRLGIAYMLSGSMAMVKYGMHRMTNDIDIVVELVEHDLERFVHALGDDYYVPLERALDSVRRKTMFNILHTKRIIKVDVVLRKDSDFDRRAFSNRSTTIYTSFPVSVIGKEDLIISKLRWGKDSLSEKQISDVAGMMRHGYDEQYVNSWAKKLDLEGILDLAKDKLANDHAN